MRPNGFLFPEHGIHIWKLDQIIAFDSYDTEFQFVKKGLDDALVRKQIWTFPLQLNIQFVQDSKNIDKIRKFEIWLRQHISGFLFPLSLEKWIQLLSQLKNSVEYIPCWQEV